MTGVAIGGTRVPPPGDHSVTQNITKMHQNTSFSHRNSEKLLPQWGGDTLPRTPLLVPPIQPDPGGSGTTIVTADIVLEQYKHDCRIIVGRDILVSYTKFGQKEIFVASALLSFVEKMLSEISLLPISDGPSLTFLHSNTGGTYNTELGNH